MTDVPYLLLSVRVPYLNSCVIGAVGYHPPKQQTPLLLVSTPSNFIQVFSNGQTTHLSFIHLLLTSSI